ncbi:MAG: PadR family transcriptional regulator [Erysipelotrichaceae bacterium]|nr:PadR family transcriptional regulator [Erysipelotrichaceae bacterium]
MIESIALTEATYYILLSLVEPRHGYGIMQEVEYLSSGRVRLAAGTLYGALNALVDKHWITQLPVEDGSRRKDYQITAQGREVLERELERLRELVNNGESVLGGK